jgi:hypothetical protein
MRNHLRRTHIPDESARPDNARQLTMTKEISS